MASYKSNYLDNKILNWICNGTPYTPPSTLYIALFTARPAANGIGGTEIIGGSYARAAVAVNTTNFPVTSSQVCPNGVSIAFAVATGTWGTVNSFALMDNLIGGNFLYIGDLTSSVLITSGNLVEFLNGSLIVGES